MGKSCIFSASGPPNLSRATARIVCAFACDVCAMINRQGSVRKIMAQTSQAKAQTMRAVALDKFGGPETLKIQNVPIPQIEAQEVLIRVAAAGVGAWDPFEREGRFVEIMGSKPKFPYVLGNFGL